MTDAPQLKIAGIACVAGVRDELAKFLAAFRDYVVRFKR